jgi:hypothetical protein
MDIQEVIYILENNKFKEENSKELYSFYTGALYKGMKRFSTFNLKNDNGRVNVYADFHPDPMLLKMSSEDSSDFFINFIDIYSNELVLTLEMVKKESKSFSTKNY